MAEQELPGDAPASVSESGQLSSVRLLTRPGKHTQEADLVHEILSLCASTFETERARFVRQKSSGEWRVFSIQHDVLTTHRADYAEIAMAWAVGLSRFPMRVTRPRVTNPEGGAVRPIAVTSYLGIPILCQDHLAGVIELAGNVKGDLERSLERLGDDLQRFGFRLTYDPSLRAPQVIDLDAECWIDGGCWTSDTLRLDADEWAVVRAIDEPVPVGEVIERLPFDSDHAVDLVRRLVSRGVVSVRASTRSLAEPGDPAARSDSPVRGDG